MSKNRNNNAKYKKGNKTETTTLNTTNFKESTISYGNNRKQNFGYYDPFAIAQLVIEIEQLKKDMAELKPKVYMLEKERNNLYKIFGWTLRIINFFLLVLLVGIIFIIAGYVYPFLETVLGSGKFWVIITILGLILAAIISLWWNVQKYIKNKSGKEFY